VPGNGGFLLVEKEQGSGIHAGDGVSPGDGVRTVFLAANLTTWNYGWLAPYVNLSNSQPAWNGAVFLAGGNIGAMPVLYLSSTGIGAWSPVTVPAGVSHIYGLCAFGSAFLLIGYDQGLNLGKAAISTDNGSSWSAWVTLPTGTGFTSWRNPTWNGNSPEAERLKEIVGLCTSPDPAGRPTAAELAGLLARPLSVPPSPIYIAQRPEPSRPSRMWAVAALVGTLVLAGAAVAVRDRGVSQVRFTNVTAKEWCEAVGRSDTKIGNALDTATTTLVAGGRTATAMRAALRELPRQVASATSQWRRWLALEPEFAAEAAALSDSNLRDFIVAETATYLATGRFIGSHSTSSEDLIRNGLPRDVATTADALGRVAERSRIACGSEGGSWRDAQIRLADEVRVSLEGPNSPFFSDPAAATALDADLLATVVAVQPGYFVRLVTANPGWLIAATARDTGSPAITSMLLDEGAKAFQEIAIGSREVAAYLHQDNQLLQMDLAETLPRSEVSGFLRQIKELSERQ